MSRFGRVARRPDHWDSPHERARLRLAERMAGDLDVEEAAWLEGHLADCPFCTSVAAQFAADRLALRALRDAAPQPPRDLWARTAAAIEQESGGGRSAAAHASRGSRLPLGALSGLAVIAVVIGVSTLSANFLTQTQSAAPEETVRRSTTNGEDVTATTGAEATPFIVGAGPVAWVDKDASGALGYNNADVDEVCPAGETSNCPALKQADQQRLGFVSEPRTIIDSPSDGQAVMVADDGAGGVQLLLVDLPERTPTPAAASEPPDPTPTTSAAATASAGAATTPSPPPSAAVPSASPSGGPDAGGGGPTPTPVLPRSSLAPSPSASMAVSLAIASDIELVGESAAFSADGSWFAFTARPSDGSRGPDIYVWRVGDLAARALTTDGSTVFASWDGARIVASRPEATTSTEGSVASVTVRIDPATAAESPAGDVWRPVVDPTRKRAIGWAGSITRSADGVTWTPDSGNLELRRWTVLGAKLADTGLARDAMVLAETATAGFDVRWDESGEWVAVWVADEADPSVGRLSLYRVERRSRGARAPRRCPDRCPSPPRLLDRRRTARVGHPARAGRRRQPDPDRGLERRGRGHRGERPGRGSRRHPLTDHASLTRRACKGRHIVVSFPAYRATQMVGRGVGAHCRPRPGRVAGSRRLPRPQRHGARAGRRVPVALGPRV